jgi:hypothetical protein
METLFQERGKRINHESYLKCGPRTILIFTCIRSIKDNDYLRMRKKISNEYNYNLVNIYNLYKTDLRYG